MIFIDSGAFLARYLSQDQYHETAVDFWDEIKISREYTCTSSFVLDEVLTLLGRRAGHHFAAERARNIYASKTLTILRPDQGDELKALGYFVKYADQLISFTDAISFVLMRKEKIKRVFSFDRHFQLAGFRACPD
jgi:predicted nucleic acid-binding protein